MDAVQRRDYRRCRASRLAAPGSGVVSIVVLPSHIEVTARHIKAGVAGDCEICPIALALAEAIAALGSNADVSVYTETVVVGVGGACWSAPLPEQARWFVGRFDTACPVEPFTFEVTWQPGNAS